MKSRLYPSVIPSPLEKNGEGEVEGGAKKSAEQQLQQDEASLLEKRRGLYQGWQFCLHTRKIYCDHLDTKECGVLIEFLAHYYYSSSWYSPSLETTTTPTTFTTPTDDPVPLGCSRAAGVSNFPIALLISLYRSLRRRFKKSGQFSCGRQVVFGDLTPGRWSLEIQLLRAAFGQLKFHVNPHLFPQGENYDKNSSSRSSSTGPTTRPAALDPRTALTINNLSDFFKQLIDQGQTDCVMWMLQHTDFANAGPQSWLYGFYERLELEAAVALKGMPIVLKYLLGRRTLTKFRNLRNNIPHGRNTTDEGKTQNFLTLQLQVSPNVRFSLLDWLVTYGNEEGHTQVAKLVLAEARNTYAGSEEEVTDVIKKLTSAAMKRVTTNTTAGMVRELILKGGASVNDITDSNRQERSSDDVPLPECREDWLTMRAATMRTGDKWFTLPLTVEQEHRRKIVATFGSAVSPDDAVKWKRIPSSHGCSALLFMDLNPELLQCLLKAGADPNSYNTSFPSVLSRLYPDDVPRHRGDKNREERERSSLSGLMGEMAPVSGAREDPSIGALAGTYLLPSSVRSSVPCKKFCVKLLLDAGASLSLLDPLYVQYHHLDQMLEEKRLGWPDESIYQCHSESFLLENGEEVEYGNRCCGACKDGRW